MFKIPCQNCNGKGKIDHYKHVEDGICFTCSGSGVQEVTEEEYNDYKQELERKKQGKYILFHKGNVEYYKTEKEITNKYGRFMCDSYGKWSVKSCYKDRNGIVYTNHTENSEEFINNCNKFYNELLEKEQREFKVKVNAKINRYKELLKEETDTEYIEMLTNKIKQLESL